VRSPSRSPFVSVAVRAVAVCALAGPVSLLGAAAPAAAHTESDVVAVPAGSEATVTLRPTHGCGESPTVAVAIRAPVAGAVAGDVAGWTATASPEGSAQTVLTWSGGSLPATEPGAFPVTFTVPATPGVLLTFPAVQTCADGEELAWISGDPRADNPAPRLLVLPAGSEPAESIDDVPPDAPGRDQLTAIVDVDNPSATTTTAPPPTTAPPTTGPAPTTTVHADDADGTDGDDGDDDEGSSGATAAVIAAVVVAVGGGGALLVRRSRRLP
jgi:periplasmic copper chaperone A